MIPSCTRRQFLATGSLAAAAALLPGCASTAAAKPRWTVGCFNRPWVKWNFDAALDSVKGAGYSLTGLLSVAKEHPSLGTLKTPEAIAQVKQQLAARGLKANMGSLRLQRGASLAEAIADVRQQLTAAHALGAEYALTFGVDRPQDYEQYFKVMADAAAFAQERGVKLVLKPHGGGSGASDEIKHAMKAVGHANFKIWYDAGNIIYYTGKDPLAELDPIVEHVTGFCAKDCAAMKSDVMIQFGTGKVDFAGVFKKFKAAGFNGPIMVECCKIGATPEETMANAKANREFLERVLASV